MSTILTIRAGRCLTALFGICLLTCFMIISSCKKKEQDELKIPSRASFSSTAFTIEKDNADPFPVTVKIARPLDKASSLVIKVEASGTAANTTYNTSPSAKEGLITLDLPQGATTASFTVQSAHNFDDSKTIVFRIMSATGSAVLNDLNLSTTLTMRGNNWVTPEMTTSVATLGNFGSVKVNTLSDAKSYTLSGKNLSGVVSITAPAGFKISTDNTTYSSFLTADVNNKSVTVYVKFSPAMGQNQSITGAIVHSLAGMNDVSINVSGAEDGNIPYVPEVPLLNENFNYGGASDFIARLTGDWVAYSAPAAIPVIYVPQGLSYTGYGSSNIGGAVTIQHGDFSREDIARTFAPKNSGNLYAALLVNVTEAGAGDFFFALRDAAGGFFNRFYAKDDGTGKLVFGVGKNTTVQYGTGSYKYNNTYLVVIKYDFAAKTTAMYVVDGAVTDVEPASPTILSATGTAPTSLNDVVIRQSDGVLSATVDGIRVATTWKGALGL
ncbi:hypothetical protein [Mucilaginibacter sp. PAMB04168]|uniref:hypothetical protein n=1 Tax=Mucilaginibacter sp. PAMB04168 TaxID=3138567 RepID=UPI0031F5F616